MTGKSRLLIVIILTALVFAAPVAWSYFVPSLTIEIRVSDDPLPLKFLKWITLIPVILAFLSFMAMLLSKIVSMATWKKPGVEGGRSKRDGQGESQPTLIKKVISGLFTAVQINLVIDPLFADFEHERRLAREQNRPWLVRALWARYSLTLIVITVRVKATDIAKRLSGIAGVK